MDLGGYSSYLAVDLEALRGNIQKMENHVGGRAQMLPVIKANCYAMGAIRVGQLLTEEFDVTQLAVAQVWEGEVLRKSGLTAPRIMIAGIALPHAIRTAIEYDLDLTVFFPENVRAIDEAARIAGKRPRLHIKLDTGMNRIGTQVGEGLERLLVAFRECCHVELVGVSTHFSTAATWHSPHTKRQFALFKEGVEQVRRAGFEPEMIHCCNSAAMIWYDEALEYSTHYRPGSIFMGYDMMDDLSNPLQVVEPMSWRAFLTNVHPVMPGDGVGYCRHFQPEQPTMVGTVSVGYADGVYRPMAMTGGPVLVRDTKTRYLACCMDQCFVDVTGIDCQIGDEVTIVGYSRGGAFLSAFELERFTGQCYQTTLCGISDRVKRIYLPEEV